MSTNATIVANIASAYLRAKPPGRLTAAAATSRSGDLVPQNHELAFEANRFQVCSPLASKLMRIDPLYRLRFDYPESWEVELKGERGTEGQLFLFAEGSIEGKVVGRFRGTNYPRRRTDRTAVTDFRGVILTDDPAAILFECHGFGRAHTPEYDNLSPGGRQWVANVTHLSDHEKYRWLNDVVCVGTGQVRPKPKSNPANPTDLVLDVGQLIWEPLPP